MVYYVDKTGVADPRQRMKLLVGPLISTWEDGTPIITAFLSDECIRNLHRYKYSQPQIT